jgi:hypothetical protein
MYQHAQFHLLLLLPLHQYLARQRHLRCQLLVQLQRSVRALMVQETVTLLGQLSEVERLHPSYKVSSQAYPLCEQQLLQQLVDY